MTIWEQWASGVLGGVGAPVDANNVDTLWGWSNAESGTDVMRWNNPLNTTQPWPGAQNMNSVGVKRYASINDGVLATVATLDNGYYPTILANLRSSRPRAQWGNACGELGKWGTGCGWLTSVYGAAPGDILAADMTPEESNQLATVFAVVSQLGSYPVGKAALDAIPKLDAILAAVKAIAPPGASGGLTAAQTAQLDTIAADVETLRRRIEAFTAPLA